MMRKLLLISIFITALMGSTCLADVDTEQRLGYLIDYWMRDYVKHEVVFPSQDIYITCFSFPPRFGNLRMTYPISLNPVWTPTMVPIDYVFFAEQFYP